jgi:hypothetical protein
MGDISGMAGMMHVVPLNAPIPPITIDAGTEEIDGAGSSLNTDGQFTATGGVTVVGGTEFSLHADSVTGNLKTGISTAVGHVVMRELNTTVDMDSLFVSQKRGEGSAQNVTLWEPPYTIQAQRIVFLPNETDAYSGVLTTCPPDEKPDFSIRASLISVLQLRHQIVVRNASVYIGKQRLITDRRLVLRLANKSGVVTATNRLVSNTFGYNGFSGAFIALTTHFGISDGNSFATLTLPEKHGIGALIDLTTTLIQSKPQQSTTVPPKTLIGIIRRTAESTLPILPYGDPLLMHWFEGATPMNDRFENIPNTITVSATAIGSLLERVYGHDTNDLFISRVPEASLGAIVPISGPRDIPTSHDPSQVRTTLHEIALYAVITPVIGRYTESPDNVTADRESVSASLESRPILVGDNLLFKPRVTFQDSVYPGTTYSFKVFQYDLAMEKYLTDRSGYGFDYQQSDEQGSSPFQFDTPYAARELDGRFQIGWPRLIVGGLVKYNVADGQAFSEELLIAPVMRSIIPRFTYDFATNSLGLGFDIEGLTF